MLAVPGPGWLTIAAGLAILADDFPWARRALDAIKRTASKWRRRPANEDRHGGEMRAMDMALSDRPLAASNTAAHEGRTAEGSAAPRQTRLTGDAAEATPLVCCHSACPAHSRNSRRRRVCAPWHRRVRDS
jgi:hypothetical protein